MVYFWLMVSLMVGVALAILLPPLWRERALTLNNHNSDNVLIARHRLAELKEQLQAGLLTQNQYSEQLNELEANLGHDLSGESEFKPASDQGRWLALIVAFVLPLTALALYAGLGNYDYLLRAKEDNAASQHEMNDVNKAVASLEQHLQVMPDDTEGWIMLGKAYKYLKEFKKAADAMARAYELSPDQAETALLYADAIVNRQDGDLAGKPVELIFKALDLEPQNPRALWLAGLSKVQTGDLPIAATLWRQLAGLLPQGSEAQQEINDLLAKLDQQIAGTGSAGAGSTAANSAPSKPTQTDKSLMVEVRLDSKLERMIQPNDTLYLYAQALNGPPLPLAIVRKKASDMPFKAVLDDTSAMTKDMKLSNYDQVRLIARVSKSGDAKAHPGDLQGMLEPVNVAANTLYPIIIDQIVK